MWFLRVDGRVLCTFERLQDALDCAGPFILGKRRVEIGRMRRMPGAPARKRYPSALHCQRAPGGPT